MDSSIAYPFPATACLSHCGAPLNVSKPMRDVVRDRSELPLVRLEPT
jgi:hypothetical protein